MDTIPPPGVGAVRLISDGMAPIPYGKLYVWTTLVRMECPGVSTGTHGGHPQKALRGAVPAPLCPVLGAILWEVVVKSSQT